jgi:hypothetical protein
MQNGGLAGGVNGTGGGNKPGCGVGNHPSVLTKEDTQRNYSYFCLAFPHRVPAKAKGVGNYLQLPEFGLIMLQSSRQTVIDSD